MQVANSCPQLSNGRPGLRTSIRIRSVCAHDVARWPRIHGSLNWCQIPRTAYIHQSPKESENKYQEYLQPLMSGMLKAPECSCKLGTQIDQSDSWSLILNSQNRGNVESQCRESIQSTELRDDREDGAQILTCYSVFKARKKRKNAT